MARWQPLRALLARVKRPQWPVAERPGDDGQWHDWTGPNGHPPLNDQAQEDRAERGQTSRSQGE